MEKNIFDQIAKKYDSEKQINLAKVIVKELRTNLTGSKTKALIDYGSGTGLVGLELADLVKSVLLVDVSKSMLEIAAEKISKRKITNTEVLQADFTITPPTLQADIIVMSLVLLHIPGTKEILQTLFNLLPEEGELYIIDFDKNDQVSHPKIHNGFTHEALKSILTEVGFQTTEIKTFHQEEGVFMGRDASMFIARSVKDARHILE